MCELMKNKDLLRLLIKLAAGAALTAVLLLFAACVIPQHGNQMFPSVKDGDLVVTLRAGCTYKTGDLCGYRDPQGCLRLGRIAAVPGEKAELPDGKGSRLIPPGSYYLLNDNPEEHGDSRSFGPVKKKDMRGTVFWLFRRRGF